MEPRFNEAQQAGWQLEGPFSGLQLHFLRRLGRLLELRHLQQERLDLESVRLLDRAIYSTYCDCLDLGVGREAQRLLHQFQVASAGSRTNEG